MAKVKGSAAKTARRDGYALALIPVLVAITLAALLLPRSSPPDAIPIPRIDHAALDRAVASDRVLADHAKKDGLPDDVRVLGSALRDLHLVEAGREPASDAPRARRAVDAAYQTALAVAHEDGLRALRAVQLEAFLAEVRRYEETGAESDELLAVGGPFVQRLRQEGWVKDRTVVPDETVRRVMFKQMWNAVLNLEQDPRSPLAPSLDELRALYAFYFTHPHPSDAARFAIASARVTAKDRAACDALDEGERMATESWRLERIERFAAIDPDYPADYARGVAQYRRGEYQASVTSLRRWLDAHPRGSWSLLAQDNLKAALAAARVD